MLRSPAPRSRVATSLARKSLGSGIQPGPGLANRPNAEVAPGRGHCPQASLESSRLFTELGELPLAVT